MIINWLSRRVFIVFISCSNRMIDVSKCFLPEEEQTSKLTEAGFDEEGNQLKIGTREEWSQYE